MKRTATAANIDFANALLRDAEARANRVSADVRWSMGSGARTAEQRSVASRLSGSLADLRAAVATAGQATDPVQSLNAARNALASSQTFVSVIPSAYRVEAALRRAPEAQLPKPPKEIATTTKTPTIKTVDADDQDSRRKSYRRAAAYRRLNCPSSMRSSPTGAEWPGR